MITELEAPCKQKESAAKKLTEEKTKLEGMIQSHDELIMEMGDECGLNCMGEDANDDDGGDAAAPPATTPPSFPVPPVRWSSLKRKTPWR
jgi:hypothetical protein